MKLVICTIQVVAGIFMTNADVKGTVISESSSKYLVNFSKAATESGYRGDYSERLVDKNQCVEVKKLEEKE